MSVTRIVPSSIVGTIVLFIFLLASCGKDTNTDNLKLTQSISVPVGTSEIKFQNFIIGSSSDSLGQFGQLIYNGAYYPVNNIYFSQNTDVDFTFNDTEGRSNWIEELEFKIYIVNGFPVNIKAQFYILGTNRVVLDSLFSNGPIIAPAANLSLTGDIASKSDTLFEVPISKSQIANLKQSTLLVLQTGIFTRSNKTSIAKFDENQLATVHTAFRMKLNVKTSETK